MASDEWPFVKDALVNEWREQFGRRDTPYPGCLRKSGKEGLNATGVRKSGRAKDLQKDIFLRFVAAAVTNGVPPPRGVFEKRGCQAVENKGRELARRAQRGAED